MKRSDPQQPTPSRSGWSRITRTVVAATLLAASYASPARADHSGTSGRLVRLSINSAGSDDYASAHGSISVRVSGKATEIYSWGGTMCPASKLTDGEIATLQSALHNRLRTLIVPRYKSGEVKDVRCLTGFELTGG